MHILKQLYIGNVRPGERSFKRNSQYARALAAAADAEEAVLATLNEEQKKLFEAFVDAQREVTVLTDAETFIYSFRLGAKFALDVLENGEMSEI